MARIVIIQHHSERDDLSRYSVQLIIDAWRQSGHEVLVSTGLQDLPDADAALLHVNLSHVPDDYAAAARRYRVAINGRALDIRKRSVSRDLVNRGDGWRGAVVVKTDLNFAGWPEWRMAQESARLGEAAPQVSEPLRTYSLYASPEEVPEAVWSDPALVVEKFLPEHDADGFYVRTWFFLGDRERSRRFVSHKWLVKGATIKDAGVCEVPDEIRAERERLEIDWGKFDFVIHEGRPILLDANKTPGTPPANPANASLFGHLAEGLDSLLAAAGTS